MRPRILIFCDFYLPGFKSGGGMWSVANLVNRFADAYDFHIVTRNYDSKGDRRPYTTVRTNEWNDVGPARVFYFGSGSLTLAKAAEIMASVDPDLVYLNSAFSLPVRQFLRARRGGTLRGLPVILAPCGEMSEGALSIKPFKKKLFLRLALASGLYRDVIWKASSETEVHEIRRVNGASTDITVAPDLAPMTILADFEESWKPKKISGEARFASVSRITPKKNLKYLLECLAEVQDGDLTLNIVGPIEDEQYWTECKTVIDRLPKNITVTVAGALPYEEGLRRLAQSHFFAMPTLNENFGYVFLEALAAGCPLLISDRTIWNDIEERGIGWSVPLEDRSQFVKRLQDSIAMTEADYKKMSRGARSYAFDRLSCDDSETANAQLFEQALAGGSRAHVSGIGLR